MEEKQQQAITYHEFKSLSRDMGEMKALMSKMVDAVNRISLLDERQQSVSLSIQKIDERTARLEAKQQEAEISRAMSHASGDRLNLIDAGFRELHIERERDKARVQTIIWMIRGLWATVTAGGITIVAKLWGFQ